MDLLCFDVASGGVSGARIDEGLNVLAHAEVRWQLATLDASDVRNAFRRVSQQLAGNYLPAAIAIDSFMHGFLVVDSTGNPLTPVLTWLDSAGSAGVELVRSRLGSQFHARTGCRYHPMFPVFKLAAMRVEPDQHVVSPKAWLLWTLTGEWVEDYGMASASGLLNLETSTWDAEILSLIDLDRSRLPALSDSETIVGRPEGVPVMNGSGDGFMATLGSGCRFPWQVAMTLGTSASARQMLSVPILVESAGTFCYRANANRYLFGCAGNNGGNVLDWARRTLGPFAAERTESNVPILIPTLNGERSPDWDPALRGSWHGLEDGTTPEALKQSVLEGVIFNLAHYVEVLASATGFTPQQVVLSGNGFLEPSIAPLLALLVDADVLLPASPGLATLRGVAMSAWRALGHDPAPAMNRILEEASRVSPSPARGEPERFARYKQLRVRASEL